MTCIVAITDGSKIYMGGDSAAAEMEGNFVTSRIEPKVFVKDNYIIGYAGSFRLGKLVEHLFELPKPSGDLDKFMNTIFLSELRECFEENKLDNSEDKDAGELLIGINGRLYEFNSDWHIGQNAYEYNSIGSGSQFAMGSLFSTRRIKSPSARITLALEASEAFSPYVRRPFTILER